MLHLPMALDFNIRWFYINGFHYEGDTEFLEKL